MPKSPGHRSLFFREFRRNFHTTGAILPSGRRLALALARQVAHGAGGRRILEVGPGTGAVTQHIVGHLHADDHFELVETNGTFVAALGERFGQDPAFAKVAARSQVHHALLEEIADRGPFDVIISGLPLNNFDVPTVERILATFARLAKPEGVVSFFEYVAIRRARALVSNAADRRRLLGIGETLRQWLAPREFARELILGNVPPAWVHHAHPAARQHLTMAGARSEPT